MRTTIRLSLAGAAAGAVCLAVAPAALAQEACEYPFDCPEVVDGGTTDEARGDQPAVDADTTVDGVAVVGDGATGSRGAVQSGAVLPFTGGEALLIGVTGMGAVIGGTALVIAGRRRVADV